MLALLACLLTALGAGAQQTEKPMLEFRTSAYDTNGESNSIQLLISSNTEGDYIDVDCAARRLRRGEPIVDGHYHHPQRLGGGHGARLWKS